jgi:hypothetical protein
MRLALAAGLAAMVAVGCGDDLVACKGADCGASEVTAADSVAAGPTELAIETSEAVDVPLPKPHLVMLPPKLLFTLPAPGVKVERALKLTNTGTAPLQVTTVLPTKVVVPLAVGFAPVPERTLLPDEATTLTVTVSMPATAKLATKFQLSVLSNDPDGGVGIVPVQLGMPWPQLQVVPEMTSLG